MTLVDGTAFTALGIGAFADKTLVHEGQCTGVDPNADPAGRLARLRRDGRTRRRDEHRQRLPRRLHSRNRVWGVGDAAIAGARLAGASPIIAIDRDPKKLQMATELGATTRSMRRRWMQWRGCRELTDGFGADVVVDAVGRSET